MAGGCGIEFRKHGLFGQRAITSAKAVGLAVNHHSFQMRAPGSQWSELNTLEELQQEVAKVSSQQSQALTQTAHSSASQVGSSISRCPFAAALGMGQGASDISPATQKVGSTSFLRTAIKHASAPVHFFQEAHAKYGESFEVDVPGRHRFLFDSRKDLLKEALSNTDSGQDDWSKSRLQGHGAAHLIGEQNMFLSGGEDWQHINNVMRSHFTGKMMLSEAMHQQLGEIFDQHLLSLQTRVAKSPQGRLQVDPREEMQAIVLDVALRVFCNAKLQPQELDQLRRSFKTQMQALNLETANPTNISLAQIPGQGKLKDAYETLAKVADRLVLERQQMVAQGQNPPNDFLTSIINARDPKTGQAFDSLRLRHEVLSLLEAGHETTATLMASAQTLLARNPQEYEKLQEEVDRQIGRGPVTKEGLDKLQCPQHVMLETLRMLPPFFLFMREAKSDIEFEGTHIPKGTTLVSNLYTAQRDESTFGVQATGFPANEFHSQRWDSQSNPKALKSNDITPFGSGRRSCIGQALGKLETEIMLVKFAQLFDIQSANQEALAIVSDLSIHTSNGQIILQNRQCPHHHQMGRPHTEQVA